MCAASNNSPMDTPIFHLTKEGGPPQEEYTRTIGRRACFHHHRNHPGQRCAGFFFSFAHDPTTHLTVSNRVSTFYTGKDKGRARGTTHIIYTEVEDVVRPTGSTSANSICTAVEQQCSKLYGEGPCRTRIVPALP